MPGTDDLVHIKIGERFVEPVPPNGNILTVYDAAGAATVVINAAGALVSALVATSITYADDVPQIFGTGSDVKMQWETADANANELIIQLPAGTGTNVPAIVIGQSIDDVDLGLFNGILDPRLALFATGARTTGSVIEFRKSRGTVASPTVLTSGDDLGTINFYGAVAAGEYVLGASIRADMAGTIATTRGPSTLTFMTATDAAPSVLTAALTLNANQSATFAGAVTASGLLTSAGWRSSGAAHWGLGAPEAVTIVSGVATVTKPIVALAGEGATTDTLDSITYSGVADGDLLLITVGALGYTITADNSATMLLGAGTRALVANSSLLLRFTGTTWIEVAFLTATA